MKKTLKYLSIIFTNLYALITLLLIMAFSEPDYSWMMLEDKSMSICDLPSPIDDDSGVKAALTFFFIAILLVIGVFSTRKRMKSKQNRKMSLSLILSFFLLIFWIYRFFLMMIECSGHH